MARLATPTQVAQAKQRIYADLAGSDLSHRLKKTYADLIDENEIPGASNIQAADDWLVYLFYCRLVRYFVPSPHARIVDWGGLYGHVTQILRTLGYLDVSNYLLHRSDHYELIREHLGIPTIYGRSPNEFNLESDSTDVVISSGVLEHVREDREGREDLVLAEMYRVLRPGGYAFIWNFPTKLGTSELLAIALRRWHHEYRYWRRDVERLIENSKFELVYFDKHKLLPGVVLDYLSRRMDPVKVMRWDDRISHVPLVRLFARDFAFVLRKPVTESGPHG